MTSPERPGQNLWIDSDGGFIGATWFWPRSAASSTAVVVVPGLAHEERTMCGGLVALAESLADAGLPTLLMDLHGCSQSAGCLDDPGIGARWHSNIRAAVRHARGTGAARVIVIGVRLGFPLAAEALAEEPIEALVAWAPIVSGRRYVRELKVMQRSNDPEAPGTIAIGGFNLPPSVVACISAMDLEKIPVPKASCVMLREMTEGLYAPWLARLGGRGVIVQEQVSTQIHQWLFGGSDQPELPHEDIRGLSRWCRALHQQRAGHSDPAPRPPAPRTTIEFTHKGRLVRETFVEIGPNKLTGVLSQPADATIGNAVRLLSSTVGPGRTFADFARDEASRGNISLRFDFAGFGTSGRGNSLPGGELYTDQGSRDVQSAIEYLRQAGHREIYGLGFCAGAWSMMQAAAPELRAAVAINVALYRQPDHDKPMLAEPARGRLARVSQVLARDRLFKRVAARVRQASNSRREPIEWLIRLCNTDVRVLLVYADPEPGLTHLNRELARGLRRQLRNSFTIQTYPGLGHGADEPSARARVFRDIAEFLANLDSEERSYRRRQIDGCSRTLGGLMLEPNAARPQDSMIDHALMRGNPS